MSIFVRRQGNEYYNEHQMYSSKEFNVDDAVVQHCRKAFNTRYRNMWVYPVYIDDMYMRYTQEFFKEVGVLLMPKISKLPKPPTRPKKDASPFEWVEYNWALDAYRKEVWRIVWGDYETHCKKGTEPILVVIKAIRTPKKKERILSVVEVPRFAPEVLELLG